ncbi:MAG: acyl-CoA dehydrogenase family protein, partial [Pseudomonadales bacterium]
MRYQLNAEELKFEAEVEAFIKAELDPEIQRRVARSLEVAPAMRNEWTRKLNRVGWVAPNWPEEHGGTGWSMRRRHQFEVLMRKHHAPETQGFGFNMVGPAIIKYGS